MKALKSAAGNSAKRGGWNPERPSALERKDEVRRNTEKTGPPGSTVPAAVPAKALRSQSR